MGRSLTDQPRRSSLRIINVGYSLGYSSSSSGNSDPWEMEHRHDRAEVRPSGLLYFCAQYTPGKRLHEFQLLDTILNEIVFLALRKLRLVLEMWCC